MGIDKAQVVFRFGQAPEVRFGEKVIGKEVVEGRVELAGLDEAHGVDTVQNVYGFELPTKDSAAANVAFPAAEMLARAELLRLPDPRMSSA